MGARDCPFLFVQTRVTRAKYRMKSVISFCLKNMIPYVSQMIPNVSRILREVYSRGKAQE
jgi:hypothetical protein